MRAESFANRTTVNLYSGNAQRNISQIVEKTETASAAFYQTCQALVPLLDGGRRPLLDAKPGAKAIKAVAGAIALINEKSTIEKDYSVSFNGTDLGKAARSGYAPLRSSLAIQGFWEAEYAKLPDHAEAERFWSEKRSAYLAAGGNKTKNQIENDGYKADILAWMEPDTLYTAMDIAIGVPSLVENGVSGSRVTSLLLQLVNARKLEKNAEGNGNYFWLAAGKP